MIGQKKVLAIIPARGGSKGIPRKNIRDVAGKPLIAWTIAAAKKSKYIDRVILTSEDEEIINVAKSFGCEVPFVRPAELSQDDTSGMEPILHAMEKVTGYDIIVLLQVTSPLRLSEDIDGCIEECEARDGQACVTVSLVQENPYWMYQLDSNKTMHPLITQTEKIHRRQDMPSIYIINGAVYAAQAQWLQQHKTFVTKETAGYVMPLERSIDIDTEIDLQLASQFLQHRN